MPAYNGSFKALHELTEMDVTNGAFEVLDPELPGVRPRTLSDDYNDASDLSLPDTVPSDIRAFFDAARMLWVFGWYYYPFYTWAGLHAASCAEVALRRRFSDTAPSMRNKNLKGLLDEAMRRGWLRPDQFAFSSPQYFASSPEHVEGGTSFAEMTANLERRLDAFRKIRNARTHPDAYWFGLPGDGYGTLRFTHHLLKQLFPS